MAAQNFDGNKNFLTDVNSHLITLTKMSVFQNRRIDQKLGETMLRHCIFLVRSTTTRLKGSNSEIWINPVQYASMHQV